MLRVFALLAFLPSSGLADTVSGNTLHNACNAAGDDSAVQFGFCIGYIGGVFDGMKFGAGAVMFQAMPESSAAEVDQATNSMIGVCVPVNAERAQLVDIVIKFLTENPQMRHESARGLIFQALQRAFPC